MTFHHITRALAAGLFATVALNAAPVWAVASDYRFEVAEVKPAAAGKSDVTLRLIHTPDKKPVNDAVIFQVSADMGPDGMPTMKAPRSCALLSLAPFVQPALCNSTNGASQR